MLRNMAFTNIQKTIITPPMALEIPPGIITEMSKEEFAHALSYNEGILIIKFGAEWCGPCKKIDPLVYEWMGKLPPGAKGAIIDIDESFELYAFLKSKRMVNGVPVILCYKRGNLNYVPDLVVVGSDENQVNAFFQNCFKLI